MCNFPRGKQLKSRSSGCGFSGLPRIILEYLGLVGLPVTPRITADCSGYHRINSRIMADYTVLLWINSRIMADYTVLLWINSRIMADYTVLRRITSDYQFGSPSGPANYQSCFPLGITANYARLPVQITKWSSGLPELFPARNYRGLPWITLIYSDLLRITPDYQFGSPSGPADYQSCFPLGNTVDYFG